MALWTGCVAGALEERDYLARLERAGFVAASVEPTRIYHAADVRAFLTGAGVETDTIAEQVDGKVMGAFIRATKPEPGCCTPECCGGNR